MQKRKIKNKSAKIILIILALIAVVFFALFAIYSKTRDYSGDEALFSAAKSSSVTKLYYDKENGAVDLNAYVPELYEEIYGQTRKDWVSYGEISEKIKNAFISMEDRKFFTHSGVDLKRSFGAFLNYIFRFNGSFGGSTITQQVIKNISGDNERSIERKLSEILRARRLESRHSKEEIFEVYMNIVELGDGVVGVGEAAEYYFGKSASELNYVEAATLVGIANAPTKYNPYKNPELCREKRNRVLYSLKECGYINENEHESLIKTELSLAEQASSREPVNSWFAETVIEDAAAALSGEKNISLAVARKMLKSGGYKIYTTVSPEIQKKLEEYFENTDNFPREIESGLEFSMVISDAESGNLLATVGAVGEKRANRILNYASVNITPASALKPLALYAPLLNSKKINWATVFDDVPVEFKKSSGGTLTAFPKNSPNVYDGLTTVKDALRVSKNTVAVRLFNMLGAEKIYDRLYNSFGFKSLVKSDMSASPLALGQLTHGVSLRKLTESYNVFSNEGVLAEGRSFVAVFNEAGDLVLENEIKEKRVFSTECARIMNKLLENVVEDGTASKITLKELVDTAGKTGTSGGGRDKLFVGYTPYFTAGIWCGYKGEKRSISFTGKTHLEIWDDIAKSIYCDFPITEEERSFSTEGLKYLPYCKDSGKKFSENCILDPRCDRIEFGYFERGNEPEGICDTHFLVKYDISGEGLATEICPGQELIDIALLKIEGRKFPYEILVNDAEYAVPYYSDGEYRGKSRGKKQFNSECKLHEE